MFATLSRNRGSHVGARRPTMDFETILFDVADHVATITFNRPERLNATNDTTSDRARRGVGHRARRHRDPGGDHHRRRRPRVLGRSGHPCHRGVGHPQQGARLAAAPRRVETGHLCAQRHGRRRRSAPGRRLRPHHRGGARGAARHSLHGRQRLRDGARGAAAPHAALDGHAAGADDEERSDQRAARVTTSGWSTRSSRRSS